MSHSAAPQAHGPAARSAQGSPMRTEDLADLLGSAAAPVSVRRAQSRVSLMLAAGAALSLLCLLAWLGPRQDWRQALAGPAFWLKLSVPISLAASAFLMLHRLGQPGRRLGALPFVLLLPFVVECVMALGSWANAPAGGRLDLLLGSSWWFCPIAIGALSVPAIVLAFKALRTLAPTRLRLAGAAAGLFAGAAAASAYALYCPEASLPFLAMWYGIGMLLPAIAGAMLGRRLLAW